MFRLPTPMQDAKLTRETSAAKPIKKIYH